MDSNDTIHNIIITLDATYLTPALAASVITLFLKWCLDLITSNTQFRREKKKIVLQHQLEVMEDAMTNLLGMWEALYALKSVMERFTAEPSPAQIELLQKAIDGVNSFKEKSIGSKNAILLYYDFSSITKEYEVNKIDNILLELSDVISRTFVRMTELQSKGDPHGLMQVESEHVANSYHLYATAIDCKMKSIVAIQDFLRKELQKMR